MIQIKRKSSHVDNGEKTNREKDDQSQTEQTFTNRDIRDMHRHTQL
jgi:hypothetical protein